MIEDTIKLLKKSLPNRIDIGGLIARNSVAHKWKATYRSLAIRELVYWRLFTLLEQADTLDNNKMFLGSRILIRSAIETLGILIYLNKKSNDLINGHCEFNEFSKITERLLLGAKNKIHQPEAINIKTIIEHSDKQYQGILKIFDDLCETAHPNYDGMSLGFSKIDRKEFITEFGDFWENKFGKQNKSQIDLCIKIFYEEYNNVWINNFKRLEEWLVTNDEILEKNRGIEESRARQRNKDTARK